MKIKITSLLSVVVLLLFAVGTRADTIYTYTGNPMTYGNGATPDVCSGGPCTISGSFTVAAPLGNNVAFSYTNITPESFSFTDGNQNIATGSEVLYFDIGTDTNGAINAWVIQLYGLSGGTTSLLTDSSGDWSYTNGSIIYNSSPGTWTVSGAGTNETSTDSPVVTPEPGTWGLFLSGILGLGFLGLRRRAVNA